MVWIHLNCKTVLVGIQRCIMMEVKGIRHRGKV